MSSSRPAESDQASIESLVKALDARKVTIAPELVDAMEAGHSKLPVSAARAENLAALRAGALVVVTGQQAGLFGGPLLTFYKAASCIVAARRFSAKLKRPVVPIFWIQSEDHDLAEISTAQVITDQGELKKVCACGFDAKESRKSVSDIHFDASVTAALEDLASALKATPSGSEIFDLLRNSYQPGKSWTEAFKLLYGTLFADEGLLFFDIREEYSQKAAAPILKEIYRAALTHADEIDSLAVTDESPVVPIRKGSPLFFAADENGYRFRLARTSDGDYAYLGRQGGMRKQELLEIIESQSARLSSSALLRPIFQDSLFPTLAYIGGDAELGYHRQIEPLYQLFARSHPALSSLSLPLLLPRASLRFIGPHAKRLLAEVKLRPEDLKLPEEELLKVLAQRGVLGGSAGSSPGEIEERLKAALDPVLADLRSQAAALDQRLLKDLEKTEGHVRNAFEQFRSRYLRAYVAKNEIVESRLRKLRDSLFPGGSEQERVLSLPHLLSRSGLGVKSALLHRFIELDRVTKNFTLDDLV